MLLKVPKTMPERCGRKNRRYTTQRRQKLTLPVNIRCEKLILTIFDRNDLNYRLSHTSKFRVFGGHGDLFFTTIAKKRTDEQTIAEKTDERTKHCRKNVGLSIRK